MKTNRILCGDTVYDITPAYRDGARAMRAGIPYNLGNPFRSGSRKHDDWNIGHTHESTGEHLRSDCDVIETSDNGLFFEEKPAILATGEQA